MIRKFLCTALCFTAASAFASVQELNQLLQTYTSLKADFIETIVDKQGNRTEEDGVLYIQKPNKFHFETTSPDQEIFISNGQQVWNVEPDLDQVTVTPLSQNLSTTPLLLLSGATDDVTTVFRVVQLDATHYTLTPLDKNSMITGILVGFNGKGIVNFLGISNTMGQKSTLTFTNVEVNPTLSPSLFTYTPPPGMSVLK